MSTSPTPESKRPGPEASATHDKGPSPFDKSFTELSRLVDRMHQNESKCCAPHDGARELAPRPEAQGRDVRAPAPGAEGKAIGVTLTVQQEQAIDLFVAGRKDVEVAAALRVHRTTVMRWRLHHLGFRAALSRRRHEV